MMMGLKSNLIWGGVALLCLVCSTKPVLDRVERVPRSIGNYFRNRAFLNDVYLNIGKFGPRFNIDVDNDGTMEHSDTWSLSDRIAEWDYSNRGIFPNYSLGESTRAQFESELLSILPEFERAARTGDAAAAAQLVEQYGDAKAIATFEKLGRNALWVAANGTDARTMESIRTEYLNSMFGSNNYTKLKGDADIRGRWTNGFYAGCLLSGYRMHPIDKNTQTRLKVFAGDLCDTDTLSRQNMEYRDTGSFAGAPISDVTRFEHVVTGQVPNDYFTTDVRFSISPRSGISREIPGTALFVDMDDSSYYAGLKRLKAYEQGSLIKETDRNFRKKREYGR